MNSLWLSVGLVFTEAVAISQATGALQYWTDSVPGSSVIIDSGSSLRTLQWFAVTLSALFTWGLGSVFRTTPEVGYDEEK